MRCSGCQQEGPSQARFCLACGRRLTLECEQCRTPLPGGARFCIQCGQPVTTPPVVDSLFTSLEGHTPRHLAEKILSSKISLAGQRKVVTVLFADLRGSMELFADREPQEARKLLDPVLEGMMEAVHRYEGIVTQVVGDGIMALFGVPLAHDDHALRGCYAALRMQETVARYAEDLRRSQALDVQIRIGMNSGEMLIRSIGSNLRLDYVAVGQTALLALRMEQLARPGTTLVTADTRYLAEGFVECRRLGGMPVRGAAEPIEVFELIAAGRARTCLHTAPAQALPRLVGRDGEMERLTAALERACAGQGQVVALAGEPGVGKSRLVKELARSEIADRCLVLQSASTRSGGAAPYSPVISMLRAYFEIEDRDEARRIREKLSRKLLVDDALPPTLPAFLALLDLPTEDLHWRALDPLQRRQRTLDAIKGLLLRESQARPLLLVFEDLEWIDPDTRSVLDGLAESLAAARILLLVTCGPDHADPWGRKFHVTRLPVGPLPAESAMELLGILMGDDPGLHELKQRLIDRTGGNPLFLEESVRDLSEQDLLLGSMGAYRPVKPLDGIELPPTVQDVVRSRLNRLSPEEQRLLRSASVVGSEVPALLLQAIAGETDEGVRRGLANLEAADLVRVTMLFPELEYTFKHLVTHRIAYASLSPETRRDLHARLVHAIESLHGDRLTEHVERLAHHAVRGGIWEKAIGYLRQAGVKALARSAHREALAALEKALVALVQPPDDREILDRPVHLRFGLPNALFPLGQAGGMRDSLRDAVTLAGALKDQRRLAWMSTYLARDLWMSGEQDRAIEHGRRALAASTDAGDVACQVAARFWLGAQYQSRGEYRRAMDFLRPGVGSLDGASDGRDLAALPSILSGTWLAWCLAERGEFSEATVSTERGIRTAGSGDDLLGVMFARFGVGVVSLIKGELDTAIPALEHCLMLSREPDATGWLPVGASTLGYAYALGGRLAEALPLLAEAVERAEATGFRSGHSLRIGQLSEAYLLAGRVDEATGLAARALEISIEQGERGHQGYALRLLGEIAARGLAQMDRAENHYRQALAIARDLGMRPLRARCHLGLGQLLRGSGQRQRGQEQLATAVALLREMDMRLWWQQASSELRGPS